MNLPLFVASGVVLPDAESNSQPPPGPVIVVLYAILVAAACYLLL